ncbi:hypothetical protein AWB75_07175 [Caballeronia catudaia]|uniref:Uncharacterized protein n=1 Tax=Caballeronia catudaia TaxID=1777136 RepID=A0A158DWQ8_9BURK|nr:hypothetical protein [Caballeronia catudaia]SAK98147.1 hypothetical protein AWB75_07175 [Caballeronia catudaia]
MYPQESSFFFHWSLLNGPLTKRYITKKPGRHCPNGSDVPDTSLQSLLACAVNVLASFKSPLTLTLTATLDGRDLGNLSAFKFEVADKSITLTPDPSNLIMIPVSPPKYPASNVQFGADGYFVMLAPLAVGTHTLEFQGGSADPGYFFGRFTLVVGP